jgi:large subunit ribosomal protein L16
MFEVGGALSVAKEALRLAAQKLPVKNVARDFEA